MRLLKSQPQVESDTALRFGSEMSSQTLVSLVVSSSVLCACAGTPWMEGVQREPIERGRSSSVTKVEADGRPTDQNRFYETPVAAVTTQPKAPRISQPQGIPDEPGKVATVVFNGMPLPQFIDSVFGVVLKRTIAIDPAVQQRRDLVSMRADKPQTPSQLFESAKTVLRAYGVTVQELPGLVRFVADSADSGSLPEVRRGRALPEVPEALRPQFHIVELENTNVTSATSFIRNTFTGKVTVLDDQTRNALILSGSPANVSAAMQAVIALDQPLMRGRNSVRIVPIYWSAEELTKRLTDVLGSEGYFAGNQPGSQAPIILLPIGPINSIVVFSNNQNTLDHVLRWAEELDQPTEVRNSNYFIYPVRNADASDIANTLSQIMGGGSVQAASPVGNSTSAQGGGAAAGRLNSRVVVDKASNSIILQASSSEYQQWYGLLKELDRPSKSALISVSVAEIQLEDTVNFGFEWMLNQLKIGEYKGTIGTIGNLGTSGIGGLSMTLNGGNANMLLNALAKTTKTRLLSNPSLMTRSGEEATISIGDEVPTITSTQSTGTSTTTGSTTAANLVQTIQYRNTGVILKVKPVVRNGGRIDLNISQEVSNVKTNSAGQTLTPSISTRKVDTKLTALDGNTIVLGGLLTDNRNNTDTGVPYAKDIPLLGNLFKSRSDGSTRNELVILITAYAIDDDFDAQSIVDAVRKRLPWSAPLVSKNALARESQAQAEAAEGSARKIAKPYVLRASPSPAPVLPDSSPQSLAPLPSDAATAAAPKAGDSAFSSSLSPTPVDPPLKPLGPGGQVTDEALKKELLEALKIKR